MTKLLLSIHVLAAILVIGPITVAASMFPRYARQAAPGGDGPGGRKSADDRPGGGESGAAGPGGSESGVAGSGGGESGARAAVVAALLHRICRGYAVAGVAVPVFGIATGAELGVLTDAWLLVSLALTAVAAAVLALAILPAQQRLLASTESRLVPAEGPLVPAEGRRTAPGGGADHDGGRHDGGRHDTSRRTAARLTMLTGVFNILWAVVVVLMIVRPGSTTGA
ncbi:MULTISPECIES: hypothetical protein [unclassified Streptomyces]|uniref:hypothetical protein n=1 Tax=unclassified Streptomyces TaxID=2593676 RepID=UPI000BF83860|nr:hypothetical protein [Streptomyces sp. Ru87]PGH48787.1 hypothetical protein CRI70_21300 [Streptomyces sp. Ru87]